MINRIFKGFAFFAILALLVLAIPVGVLQWVITGENKIMSFLEDVADNILKG